jgi:hypothetical protein
LANSVDSLGLVDLIERAKLTEREREVLKLYLGGRRSLAGSGSPPRHSLLLAFAIRCGLYYSVQDEAEDEKAISALEDLMRSTF